MLSLPDFKEKTIVFIKSKEISQLKFQNGNIVLFEEGHTIDKMSCYKIFCIFIVGECSLTSGLIRNCQQFGISIILMKFNFSVYAVIGAETEGNTLLRLKQYQQNNCFEIAKLITKNKICNQIDLLKEIRQKKDKLKEAIKQCQNIEYKIEEVKENQQLMGVE